MAKSNIYMQSPSGEVFTTSSPEYHQECTRLTIAAGKVARTEYCAKQLRKFIKPGQKVYCLLRSASRSGMSRSISLLVVQGKELRDITNLAADTLQRTTDKHSGIIIGGCGMDMGFALVSELGSTLWPKGTKKPHGRRNGAADNDGGYALKHSWL